MANSYIQSLITESLSELNLTAKQKAVLTASLKLFSEKGFERTSTHDIAQSAGVSEGTVYKQFKTKEGILAAIIEPFIQKVLPKAVAKFTAEMTKTSFPDFNDFLLALIRNRMTFAFDNMPQLRIILHEVTTNEAIVSRLENHFQKLLVGPMASIFKKYQETGQLVKWPTNRILRYIVTTIMGYVLPAALARQTINIEQVSREAAEFLLKGLKP
ncbi:TetR/AcrR family transcriptional regulator [Lentilactobacillus farraginis]|uniref:Transcriptional regulator n=1 Tax=Lentilactobacillus farraginis DSM 18382 = JCM 14108 TaxID=1423743 RepID=X0PHC0_9LACO|nr:TetR/AcrR family transcriptional regulator [Lentilactobacillus farraginis]KRM08394.1 transcriptional regulator [Lentilactobacillus farraginis DSM 18382 = JCM 14108]GAF35841.1 transcriptional regulator, TetR family [Lentilactobacillus farraginis DSM 18382 = JCM 14108]